MTALKQYQRLETFGIWHASPTDQRRDVVVQLGDATLTISDQKMQPLSHWSLAAVVRLNPGEMPATFSPGRDMAERLEIEDETMTAALERLLATLRRRRGRPRRLRRSLSLLALGAVLLGLGLWLPGALVREAVAVVPQAKRQQLGQALRTEIERSTGAACAGVLGQRALDRLRARLLPDRPGRTIVLPRGLPGPLPLPGGLILLDRPMIEAGDDPAILAGQILVAEQLREQTDPLARLLRDTGLPATLRLLVTGNLPAAQIREHADALLAGPAPTPNGEDLARRFVATSTPAGPYAATLPDQSPIAVALAAAQPTGAVRPLLTDSDWVSLQGICGD